jgi:hypothetical protein
LTETCVFRFKDGVALLELAVPGLHLSDGVGSGVCPVFAIDLDLITQSLFKTLDEVGSTVEDPFLEGLTLRVAWILGGCELVLYLSANVYPRVSARG